MAQLKVYAAGGPAYTCNSIKVKEEGPLTYIELIDAVNIKAFATLNKVLIPIDKAIIEYPKEWNEWF